MSYDLLADAVDALAANTAALTAQSLLTQQVSEAAGNAATEGAQLSAVSAEEAAEHASNAGNAAKAAVDTFAVKLADLERGSVNVGHRNSDVFTKLSDFIAATDFTGTDAEAIVKAGEFCATNKKQLRIDRDVTITALAAPIELRCSYYQQPGVTVNVNNTGLLKGLFKFTTAQTGTVVTGVTGLAEGSTKLTGLPAAVPGSWLVISSTEELIKDTSAGAYVKQEVVIIADILGGLCSPLMSTYDSPTITLFAPEDTLSVDGLVIKGDGTTINDSNHNMVEIYRRSANIEGLSVQNAPNRGSQIKFNQTTVCSLKNPKITGHTDGNGYGILAFMTETLFVENPAISNCRHAYAARHDKNTMIVGGYMAEVIDSHWGQNLVVMGTSIVGQIQYAGRDISVTGCHQIPLDYCIRVRNTSPELKGKVIYEGNTVTLDASRMAGTHFAYYTSGLSTGTYEYGRSLAQPDLVSIKNNILKVVQMPANISYARMLTATGFRYTLGTRFNIAGNTRTDTSRTIYAITGFVKADNVDLIQSPVVFVDGETNLGVSVVSQNTAVELGRGFTLDIKNVNSFTLFANTNALVESKLRDVSCAGWVLPAGGAHANTDNGRLVQDGMQFNGVMPVEFSRIMAGEIFFRSMPNDSVSYIRPRNDFGQLSVISRNSLQWSGIAAYDVEASGAFNQTVFAGGGFATRTGALTGTTGEATKLTLSPATDGRVYIENRAGAALSLHLKEMNLG